MSVTPSSTDQPYGQIITDQPALEKVFRAHYTRLVIDAKGRLGDASGAAPRVVSKAFHLAWNDRKRFHSMDELDAFLGAQIHHGAAREQSRIAGLHRMDSHAGGAQKEKHDVTEMGVDEAWERLQHTLEGGAPEAYRKRASNARHEAAEHVAQLGKTTNWVPALIIAGVAIVLAGGAFLWIEKAGESRAIDRALNAGDARATETGSGQIANVTLDDGTVVHLGPESKLTVPKRFGMTGGFRAVKIDGAAGFDVSKTAGQPFEVRNGQVAIIVRGTKFIVRRYKDDVSLVVHVREGTLDVRLGEEVRSVTNGMSYAVTGTGQMRVPTAAELSEASTWADGTLTISGRTLRYVRPQLKRWYGLDVQVPDVKLLDRQVFVSAPLNSPKEVLSSIEKSGGLKFTYIGESMAFTDTAASRATKATKATKKR